MRTDKHLALDAVRATEAAALASARLMGRGDVHQADEAAVAAMRKTFDSLDIRGRVVIGEGDPHDAPILYDGEKVGHWQVGDVEVEVAADPLEGARLCARGMPNAISVVALTRNGHFLRVPDTYMYKMAVGPAGRGALDMSRPVRDNLQAVADAKGVYVEDLMVVVLERPRHEGLLREIREAGARIKLIPDGDVAAAMATCIEETGIDLLIGTGGATEGVIAAAALRCVGGDMKAQIQPRNAEESERVRRMGVELERTYDIEELAGGDVLFAATGITDGDFLRGVRFRRGGATTHSVVMRSRTMTVRIMEAHHRFEDVPSSSEL